MTRDAVFTAIDVGTSKVLTLIARRGPMDDVEILGAGLAPSAGMRKGAVVDAGAAQESVRASIADARQAAGVQINSAFVNVSGVHVEAHPCWGALHSLRQNAPITGAELHRALEAAYPSQLPTTMHVLHKLPRMYVVDGLNDVRNPVGLHALRLDVEALCVAGEAAPTKALVSVIQNARVRVEKLVASPLAAAEAVLGHDDMERGVALLDIGSGVTTIALYRQGALWNASTLPLGGNQFTSDLSLALTIPFPAAEELKLRYGQAALDLMDNEPIVLQDVEEQGNVRVDRRTITRFLHDRAGELFRLAGIKLQGFGYPNLPPGGIVLTGGGSNLKGIERVARQVLGSPVRFALPENPPGLPYDLRDPAFSAGVGTLLWAMKQPRSPEAGREQERNVRFNAGYAQANAGPLSWLKGRMSKVAS